jgi:hypothetical protein
VINSSSTFALDFSANAEISLSFASTSFCAACSACVLFPECYLLVREPRMTDLCVELFKVFFFLSFVGFYILGSLRAGIFDFLRAIYRG